MAVNPSMVAEEKHERFMAYFDRAIAQICKTAGWQNITPDALSTLSELMLDKIVCIGKSSVAISQHSCRTIPSFYDVQCAIAECGIKASSIRYSKPLTKVANPVTLPIDRYPTLVKISSPLPQPSYIPDYLNLLFPQPHTYIKTPAYNLHITSYTKLREARAKQRNEVINSLSKQMVSLRPSTPLIPGRDDCIWATPDNMPSLQYLFVHAEDYKTKKKKKKICSNNPYLQPPKCSWSGLFT